jgi:hypothetical protein
MTQKEALAEDTSARPPLFVWTSTDDSIRLGVPSVLAAFEVIAAIVIYGAIAIYFGIFYHLWVSICMAPLLLLRSEQSTKLGLLWFAAYVNKDLDADEKLDLKTFFQSKLTRISLLCVLLTSALIGHVVALHWLGERQGWTVFLHSTATGILIILVGVIVAAAIQRTSH